MGKYVVVALALLLIPTMVWYLGSLPVRFNLKGRAQLAATPTPSPTTTAVTQAKVFVVSLPFGIPTTDPQNSTQEIISKLKDGSRYHGFANASAQAYVEFQIYGGSIVRETSWTPPRQANGNYDISAIYSRYNLCSLIQAGQVNEVWLWDAGQGGFLEWITKGPEWSSVGSDYSVPDCGKQVTTMVFNYTRGVDVALESYNHRLEGLFMHYFPCDFYTQTWPWTGWPQECSGLVSNRYGYVGRPFSGNDNIGVCGDAHTPPNILDNNHPYTYNSQTTVQSICEDWQMDGTARVKLFNCQEWHCDKTTYHVWWMQNLPGYQNTNKDLHGNPMPNWWTYLFGSPPPSPTAATTPTPTLIATATPSATVPATISPSVTPVPTAQPSATVSTTPLPTSTPTPVPGNLTLFTTFQGITTHKPKQVVIIVLSQGNHMRYSFPNQLGEFSENGVFSTSITGVTPGSYQITLKGWVHLNKALPSYTITSGQNQLDLSSAALTPGDVNGDNIINALDLSLILNNYFPRAMVNSNADLNLDARVNAIDLGLVIEHYFDKGDQ